MGKVFSIVYILFCTAAAYVGTGAGAGNGTAQEILPQQEYSEQAETETKAPEEMVSRPAGDLELRDKDGSVLITTGDIEAVMPVTLENGGKNEYVVKLVFTEEGGEKFRDITQKSIGETLYIYVDGSCVSAPVINSVIASGEVYISGISSYEDAKELAALIQGDESVRN